MIGSSLSIFRKGLFLVGLPITVQLVLLGVLLSIQAKSNNADLWALHTKEVMVQAETAHRLLSEAVTHMRGLIITNDPNFSPEQSAVGDQVLPAIDELEHLVSDNPPQVMRVRAFKAGASELLQWLAGERDLVAKGMREEAARRVVSLDGERRVRDLRNQLQILLDEEQRLDTLRLDRVARLRVQGYWFVGVAAVVTLLLAGGALWIFTRGIASRLSLLAQNASLLAERRPLINAIGGPDEIGQVGEAFQAAALRLADAESIEEKHRGELESRAQELAAANSELGRTNEDLRFKTQEIETFVYSVSHDLRSPLVNLQGFGRELSQSCEELRKAASDDGVPAATRQRMTALIDGDVLESVRFIQTAVSRSGTIIDALLRLSRAGRVEYKRQCVDVREIVGRVIDAMQGTVRQRKAEIIVGSISDAESDPAAVEQIFGNIIGNAVNYLDPARPGRVEVGMLPASEGDASLVRYFVRDNGMGIPAAYLPKMFMVFQRLHGDVAPGEGIGLALVRRVVERLGGTVTIESTEGVGSTFMITLPAVKPQAVNAEAVPTQ